jgi:plasmid replication initiation protein
MKSEYSIHLYEILKSYENLGTYTVELEELKQLLMLSDKYDRYDNFRTKIIETALKEINEKTDIIISYKPIREGRTIKKLRFTIAPKASIEAAITRIKNNELLEENINNETE